MAWVSVGRYTPERPVVLHREVEPMLAAYPSSLEVRGMYFSPLVAQLGDAVFREVAPRLLAAPRLGGYLPFGLYPQRDHARLLCALARIRFGEHPVVEGVRRLARGDVRTYAESPLGRVVLAMVADAESALLRLPSVYTQIAPGIECRAAPLPSGVRLEFEPIYGFWTFQLGQIEATASRFRARPEVEVLEDARAYRFDVTLLRP